MFPTHCFWNLLRWRLDVRPFTVFALQLLMNRLSSKPSVSRRREILEGYLFAAPFLLGFLIFVAFPMGWALVLNFQKYNLLAPPAFVGMENINRALSDPKVGLSLWNTAYFALVSVPLQLLLAFACAVLLNQPLRGRNFYRTALYLPDVVPVVVSAFIWQRAYHPEFGIINEALQWLGLARPVRHVGYAAYDYGFDLTAVFPLEFDGILFIDHSTASRLLPRRPQ